MKRPAFPRETFLTLGESTTDGESRAPAPEGSRTSCRALEPRAALGAQ